MSKAIFKFILLLAIRLATPDNLPAQWPDKKLTQVGPTRSTFRKDTSGFWLYINDRKAPPIFGMVYQPTEDSTHIDAYKNNFGRLYSALLPEALGGKGHGRRLEALGINTIRVYELPVSNSADVDSVKKIFRYVFEQYGIRVLVGDWVGLYNNIDWPYIGVGIYQSRPDVGIWLVPRFQVAVNAEYAKISSHLRLLARAYCQEPWLLGWQLGNENNYYIARGKFRERIPFGPWYYYQFMDYAAAELRRELVRHNAQQFIALGNGDLTIDEAFYINNMKNIDAVGINCYRDLDPSSGFADVVFMANRLIDHPIYFAEYGKPAASVPDEKVQSEYVQQVAQYIFSNTAHTGGEYERKNALRAQYTSSDNTGYLSQSNVLGGFIHEATDEGWKYFEHGQPEDSHYGIFGKESERNMISWARRLHDFAAVMPDNNDPVVLLTAMWNLLQGEYAQKYGPAYGHVLKYANHLIGLYKQKADSEQLVLVQRQASYGAAAVDSNWALNSVGTAYFIKGRCNMEMARHNYGAGMKTEGDQFLNEAIKDFQWVASQYPYAHLRDSSGGYFLVSDVIKSFFPELSKPYIENNPLNYFLLVIFPLGLILGAGRRAGHWLRRLFTRKEPESKMKMQEKWTIRSRLAFVFLVTVYLHGLYFFILWWYHPVRLEFYTVNHTLYWILSIIGLAGFVFYLYIWYILWAIKSPRYEKPNDGLAVAMVTTYVTGEPVEMIEQTLVAMKRVRYPHIVYLLDESNSPALTALCKQLDVEYFSRRGIEKYNTASDRFQRRTKGGNLNAWLDTFGGDYEFVAFLDPDHVPHPDFLDLTLGYFKEPQTGFVQAPAVLSNQADNWIARGAAEQSYFFFGPIQQGLFGLGSCMLNGSHTTLRVKALAEIGGYAVHDADDVLTGVRLNALGYSGVYIPKIIAVGLAPNTWSAFFNQQRRWAASVFNLMLFYYPALFLKYGWRQILTYYVLGAFYLLGALQIVLVILPLVSIWTNNAIANADFWDFIKHYSIILLAQYLILIGIGRQFLIKNASAGGFWYRAGGLWVAAWPYYGLAFFKALLGKAVRDRQVTPKDDAQKLAAGQSKNIRFFIPHLLTIVLSVSTLFHYMRFRENFKETRGMLLFLILIIISQCVIFIMGMKKRVSDKDEPA